MKKIYMTPELEEIKIKSNMSLLAGSLSTDGIDTGGFGGTDDGSHEPGAPELPGMPDFGPSIGSTLPLDF